MKTILSKIDELDMKINCLKKRRILIDNNIRDYESKLSSLIYIAGSGGDKSL